MEMFEAVHPGEILREDVLNELELSVAETADRLGISRVTLSRVLNCRAGISPNLARRLEEAGVRTARQWMVLQTAYELWQESRREKPQVKKLQAA